MNICPLYLYFMIRLVWEMPGGGLMTQRHNSRGSETRLHLDLPSSAHDHFIDVFHFFRRHWHCFLDRSGGVYWYLFSFFSFFPFSSLVPSTSSNLIANTAWRRYWTSQKACFLVERRGVKIMLSEIRIAFMTWTIILFPHRPGPKLLKQWGWKQSMFCVNRIAYFEFIL